MELQLLKTSLAPVRRELTQPVASETRSLAVAINNKRIVHRAVEDLKEVLRVVIIKVGLRANNWPNEIEKQVLLEHIISNYGGHTCEEIKLAFDMAVSGKLQFEKGESANCYENFSCLYFSTIMNTYRKWADQERDSLDRMIQPDQRIYTEEEILNQRRGEIEAAFQAMRKGYLPILHGYFEEVLKADFLFGEGETKEDFFKRVLESGFKYIYSKS